MRDLLLTLAVALVLGAIVFGAVAFTLGRTPGLEPVDPDAAPYDLPVDAPVTAADVEGVRFDVVLRGYRMDQVDAVLERLTYDLRLRDGEISALRAEARAARDPDPEQPAAAEPRPAEAPHGTDPRPAEAPHGTEPADELADERRGR